ncbi:DUF1330 domain-containing protein [Aquabacterium sp.]|uniref:DUF1330 domain-containing protein n=1 Tax=Aquabacterium sp. TaxID=1872578 RepID=UPI002BD60350|nr:DUF1330 domain-containing protein [Aquabacterium sp.]HSW03321.1 DUF1330 domain-containing protein [Aquabacterium sp.]
MSAYIHGSIEVTDPETYEEYRRQVPAVIAAYGGRYLVRGGATTVLEGEGAAPGRQVILEFPDMASLKAFYHSPEYAKLIPLRQRASTGRLVAIEGV